MPPGFGKPQMGPLISQAAPVGPWSRRERPWVGFSPETQHRPPRVGFPPWSLQDGKTGRIHYGPRAHTCASYVCTQASERGGGLASVLLVPRPQTLRIGAHHPQRPGLGHPTQVASARALLRKGARELLEEGPNSCPWDKMSQGGRPPRHRTPLISVVYPSHGMRPRTSTCSPLPKARGDTHPRP